MADPDLYAEINVNGHTVGYEVATPARSAFSGRRYTSLGVFPTPPTGALRVGTAFLADMTRWTVWRTPWPWVAITGSVAVGLGVGVAAGRRRH